MTKFWKEKIFWINTVAVALTVLNYTLTNNLLPKATTGIELAIAVLTAIGNAIGGGVQVAKLKARLPK